MFGNFKNKIYFLKYYYWCSNNTFTPFPYRKYMHENKIIFIHIPRTGGTSILRYFYEKERGRDHSNWLVYKQACSWAFENYFKFAIIRNPWDRVASSYNYLLSGGNQMDDLYLQKYLKTFKDFDSFVRYGLNNLMKRNVTLFRPQIFFICDSRNNVMVDKILRFENFSDDIKTIPAFRNSPLEKINYSTGKRYIEMYTDKSIDIIRDYYSNDIETLGYKYEG